MRIVAFILLSLITVMEMASGQVGFVPVSQQASGKDIYPIGFQVKSRCDRKVSLQQLMKAKVLEDFIEGYPNNWIDEYVSVEIVTREEGKLKAVVAVNNHLSSEQKELIRHANVNEYLEVHVKYRIRNTTAGGKAVEEVVLTDSKFDARMVVVPEKEATYPGGEKTMKAYFQNQLVKEVPEWVVRKLGNAAVLFTVTESGEIVNVKLEATTGDKQTDQKMIDAVSRMPRWIPARSHEMTPVSQDLKFSLYQDGC